MSLPDEADQPTVIAYAVSLKLPNFWPSDPELWFAQIEAMFAAQNVTQQKTKFGHVVRVLSGHYASEVRDVILRPPKDPNTALKTELQKHVVLQNDKDYSSFNTSKTLPIGNHHNFYGIC